MARERDHAGYLMGGDVAAMSRQSFLAALRDYHQRWEAEAVDTVIVDPEYADRRPSQYSETIVDMSASVEQDDRYWRRVRRLMNEHLPNP